MPSFGGETIFGTEVTSTYLDGIALIRGRYIEVPPCVFVTGALRGDSSNEVYSALTRLKSRCDGVARDLVDCDGVIWPNMQLVEIRIVGPVRQSPNRYLFRTYDAQFLLLDPVVTRNPRHETWRDRPPLL